MNNYNTFSIVKEHNNSVIPDINNIQISIGDISLSLVIQFIIKIEIEKIDKIKQNKIIFVPPLLF